MGLLSKKRIRNKSTGRDYAKERAYDSSPARRKARASRNRARRALMKKGLVRVGDGRDVDHRNSNPNDNRPGNWRILPKSKNRSFHRTRTAKEKKLRPGQFV